MKKLIVALALLSFAPLAMAQRVVMPYAKVQFFDKNGKPLAGGKLYTYVAGTTTPLASYTSASGAANTNPIILDAGGRANVWLDCDYSYKFILKDKNDVQQWSVDSVTDYGCQSEASTAAAVDLTDSTAVSGILASTYGGTGNGYTKFTGPASAEKTFTLPNASDTIATWDTLNIWTAAHATTPVALTVAGDGTIATDASESNLFRVTLTTDCPCTLSTPTNPTNGQIATWEVIQASGGNETLAYSSAFAFGSVVTTPTITVTAGKRDFITAVYNSTTTKWYVLYVTQGY